MIVSFFRIDHLIALNHDNLITCYGMPKSTGIIAKYNSDRMDALRRGFELALTAALSWRFNDNILRIKLMQSEDSLWINLMDLHSLKVSKIAFSPSNDHLYIGFENGLIRTYSLTFKNDQKQWAIAQRGELFAHTYSISSLQISDNFHIALSTSTDSTACLWDTNRLEFIRKLTPTSKDAEETLTLSCISSISGDIALVFDSLRIGSRVSLYTVNGDVIGHHNSGHKITSIAMTNLDEGCGINCLALGMENGVIRLLDMWTLGTVRLISCERFTDPIIR
jgi:WD40 repeat protein